MSLSPFQEYLRDSKKARRFRDYPHLVYRRDQPTPEARANLEYDPAPTNGMELIHANSRYLASEISAKDRRLYEANLIFVKSDKGTGKTQWLKEYVAKLPSYRSVLVLTHRRSLARTLSNALEVKCYLDDPQMHWRYTLSLDSLSKANSEEGYDVLIIDESEQVFRHLVGDTTKEKREEIFNTLLKLVRYAKQIICCDADMTSELTGHLMSKLRSNFEQDRILTIVNHWKTDRPINVFESKYHAIASMVCDVEDGKRVYVPVGEKGLATELQVLFKYVRKPEDQPVKVLVLTGDTSDEDYAKAFFSNPNQEAVKYDLLIATSTLSTGVSIDADWFDAVYGIFDGSVYTFTDCDQAISRARNCPSMNVWIHPGQAPEFTSEQAIRNGPKKKELITRRICLPGEKNELSKAEELYLDVDTRIRWCEQNWKANRCNQFIDLKRNSGWRVQRIPAIREWEAAGRNMRQIGKDPTGTRKYKPVLEAENLTPEEFESLRDNRNLPAKQRHAVKKYRIAEVFGLPSPVSVTMDHIVKFHEDDIRAVIRNIKLISESQEYARHRDKMQRENPNGMTFTLFDHRAMKHRILSGAVEAFGIDPIHVLENAKRYSKLRAELESSRSNHKPQSRLDRLATGKFKSEFEKIRVAVNDTQLARVAQYVSDNLEDINMFLGTKFTKPDIPENRSKVFNAVLGKFGVAIKLDRRMVDGVRDYGFIIDYDRVVELAATRDDLLVAKSGA